ncbi:retinoblastoma-related protein 1-like [Trifolium pratense]|uniref:Retinoblastoma-related protein 1-like n=1 Tax=Trifolium pratense TaxID=57577 RepID=A0A2K3NW83_TRIPR|nr:retinoblastoma-related protein 1-like [Trifolium pratense]
MLAAVRIRGMVERLQLSQRTREDVYSIFQRILNERTHLFFNRHIDQIMWQQKHVGIITFYNDIFTPSVWPLVMELVTDEETVKSDQLAEVVNSKDGHLAQCLVSPKIVPFPRFPVMHRENDTPQNIRVSPLSSSEIIMLGAVRIDAMVEKLQLSQQTGENDLTFPGIIASYGLQPQYTPPVFHTEFVDWPLACLDPTKGQAYITNIVKYYHDIFFPYVKPLLSELYTVVTPARSYKIAEFINKADGHLAQCPEPPKIFTFPSLPVMSVEEKSAAHYAGVSPIGSSEVLSF